VDTGPYKYLRHPSYTGLFVNFVATFWLIFYQGLWDVGVDFTARMAAYFVHHKTPVMSTIALLYPFSPHALGADPPGTILGISSGMWLVMMYTALMFYMTWGRIAAEEEMLRKHFKTEWDTYAKTRWRLVPFVF
jgi:protein-S-isoprenylcysteine O-methyltransferase Ste14